MINKVEDEINRDDSNSTDDFTWKNAPTWTPHVYDFDENNSGIQNQNISGESTALTIFHEFLSEEIINKIVLESNYFYKQIIEKDANMKQNMRSLEADEFTFF